MAPYLSAFVRKHGSHSADLSWSVNFCRDSPTVQSNFYDLQFVALVYVSIGVLSLSFFVYLLPYHCTQSSTKVSDMGWHLKRDDLWRWTSRKGGGYWLRLVRLEKWRLEYLSVEVSWQYLNMKWRKIKHTKTKANTQKVKYTKTKANAKNNHKAKT